MLGYLQRIGKALMLPIAVLPAAALLLRLGQEDLLDVPVMAQAGDAIFANLALLFAIGIAIGLSKDGSGAAALSGAVGYLILTSVTQAIDKDINMGVLAGFITGLIVGPLYNRFYKIKLPDWLAFFGGRRFVPIVTAVTMLLMGVLFGFIWPPIQDAINALGEWLIGAGALGVGVYGFLNRLLIPVGLHHVINSLVWFVFGEYNGATGDLHRFFAGDPDAGIFMTGFFPVMMFGLPAAALAMIAAAKKEKRKLVSGMLIGVGFTSFLTGITEPLEFMFMFLSPLLYFIHAVLMGTSMAVTYVLGIRDGFGFSGSALDFALNWGIATKPGLLIVVGLVYGVIYYFIFYFLIKKFDLKTPGREDDDEEGFIEQEGAVADSAGQHGKYAQLASEYMEGLGGKDNITNIDNCVTRLRMKVKDMSKVDEARLKRTGAKGVMKLSNTDVQVIVGTDVEFVADEMKKL
ncbi:MAG TPA: N-acetylglucosamine-specific PTS transporter subunit IIBC [Bacillaceae bacterium]